MLAVAFLAGLALLFQGCDETRHPARWAQRTSEAEGESGRGLGHTEPSQVGIPPPRPHLQCATEEESHQQVNSPSSLLKNTIQKPSLQHMGSVRWEVGRFIATPEHRRCNKQKVLWNRHMEFLKPSVLLAGWRCALPSYRLHGKNPQERLDVSWTIFWLSTWFPLEFSKNVSLLLAVI